MDATEDGKRLKLLTVIDEFTRESVAIRVARSITADDVIEELLHAFEQRGAPQYIRSDNGPEFVAEAIRTFLKFRGTDMLYIEPGSPWENGYIESFNSIIRDELLNRELFANLTEVEVLIERFRQEWISFWGSDQFDAPFAAATNEIRKSDLLAWFNYAGYKLSSN